jgi:hypothetical protein
VRPYDGACPECRVRRHAYPCRKPKGKTAARRESALELRERLGYEPVSEDQQRQNLLLNLTNLKYLEHG